MSRQPLSELSIEELLRQAHADEEGAVEELFRRCQPELSKWARTRASQELPGGARGSDLTQEAALRAFQRFATFKGSSKGEWFTWLKRIFHSQLVQLIREAQSQKRDTTGTFPLDAPEAQEAPAPQPSPSQLTSQQEELRQLATNVYHLPEDQRAALSLYLLKRLSVAEVASHMGRSKTSVESLMQRGVRTIKLRMAGETSAQPEGSPEAAVARNAADAAFSAYLRRCEAGEVLNPDDFASLYPECADELRGMLHWMDRLRALRPSGSS